jgi:hypothetical protein
LLCHDFNLLIRALNPSLDSGICLYAHSTMPHFLITRLKIQKAMLGLVPQ